MTCSLSLALPLTCWEQLGKSLPLSVPQLHPPYEGDGDTHTFVNWFDIVCANCCTVILLMCPRWQPASSENVIAFSMALLALGALHQRDIINVCLGRGTRKAILPQGLRTLIAPTQSLGGNELSGTLHIDQRLRIEWERGSVAQWIGH